MVMFEGISNYLCTSMDSFLPFEPLSNVVHRKVAVSFVVSDVFLCENPCPQPNKGVDRGAVTRPFLCWMAAEAMEST